MKGELVGINEAKSSSTSNGASVDNVGYSIPIDKAEPILEKLMNQETKEKVETSKQGYLGISTANVTSETSQLYKMPVGVCIRELASGGPADKAGAKKGDVITELDGKTISSYSDLKTALSYCAAGSKVSMVVQRANGGTYKSVKLTVTLGSKDAISSLSGSEDESNSGESGGNGQSNPYEGNSGAFGN